MVSRLGTPGGAVSNERDVNDEIERHIRERDRLLSHAQRGRDDREDGGKIELTILAEQERMAARIALLEEALRAFTDETWLSLASADEIATAARAALDGEIPEAEEHWLARVERIAASA
jgi:hypothetical protein